MATLPNCVLDRAPFTKALKRKHQGKVRDTFIAPGDGDGLLQWVSDAISGYNFVLPVMVPFKGEVLTAMTVFWATEVLNTPHHLLAYGAKLPAYVDDRDRRRMLQVQNLEMLQAEAIVRGYLTGGGYEAYQETGEVCGIKLPLGLVDGSPLNPPIFTPTRKSEDDEHIRRDDFRRDYGCWLEGVSLGIYHAASAYAWIKGVILADTKFEFGLNGVLADEVLTPDSSRFWERNAYRRAMRNGSPLPSMDKQHLRDVLKTFVTPFFGPDGQPLVGLNRLKGSDPAHVAWVHTLDSHPEYGPLLQQAAEQTGAIYLKIFEILVGMTLERFQKEKMGLG